MSDDLMAFPERLPVGERVLWQGRPCWRTMARRTFHIRMLAAYFALLLVWYASTVLASGATFGDAAFLIARMTGLALIPLGLVALYACMSSRNALYMVTTRRIVLKVGVAMPITFNLPFNRIEAAGLKTWADGSGNIALSLAPPDKLAYLVLWPHAKPWRMSRPEPMLRCIPDAARVGRVVARALAVSAELPVQAAPDAEAPTASGRPRATALA